MVLLAPFVIGFVFLLTKLPERAFLDAWRE
jgi:hypothetical protein